MARYVKPLSDFDKMFEIYKKIIADFRRLFNSDTADRKFEITLASESIRKVLQEVPFGLINFTFLSYRFAVILAAIVVPA